MKITKEDAETILAYHQGKQIQFKNHTTDGSWINNIGTPGWDFDNTYYRVKAEPKDIWVNEYKDEFISYSENHMAVRGAHNHAVRVAVHYREVIEK